jgi:hypothetical protein
LTFNTLHHIISQKIELLTKMRCFLKIKQTIFKYWDTVHFVKTYFGKHLAAHIRIYPRGFEETSKIQQAVWELLKNIHSVLWTMYIL